ncbi:MAG: hypothetical protein IH956_05720 [Chloroflexi bacterium]|nr:hypothetical protein [Chloroflexota bacterium]
MKTVEVSTDVLDVVLGGNGYVYAFPRTDQWETIRSINTGTETETQSTGNSIRAGTFAKLHPDGTTIYGTDNGISPDDVEKYEIAGGTAAYLYDSPYHGDYSVCGDLWISEDGLRVFTRCGNVFRSSGDRNADMTYNGSLSELKMIEHMDHSLAVNKVVAIPTCCVAKFRPGLQRSSLSDMIEDVDAQIQIYAYDFLTLETSIDLPPFVVADTTYSAHGRFVFFSSDGNAIFVVAQADEQSGLLLDYGIITFRTQDYVTVAP